MGAKVRQPYNEPVIVPWLGDRVVNPRQVVEVTDEQLPGFVEAGWVFVPETKKNADEQAPAAQGQEG